jgi:hypothetical protein
LSKVKGQPFTAGEIHIAIGEAMEELSGPAGGSTNEEVA